VGGDRGSPLAPATASGSEIWPRMAYQPFSVPNGICLSPVTYIGYYAREEAVEMTCWPDRIWHPEDGKTRQENAAFAAGFKVFIDWTGWSSQGDTLKAELDVGRALNVDDLAAATVESIKANAGQYAPGVHYLALKILGARKYAKLGGVFDVTGYNCGPKTRQF